MWKLGGLTRLLALAQFQYQSVLIPAARCRLKLLLYSDETNETQVSFAVNPRPIQFANAADVAGLRFRNVVAKAQIAVVNN